MTTIFKTVCLATKVMMRCNDTKCRYKYIAGAEETLVEKIDDRKRSNNYAVNILYVLGFITCGDGGKEAARLLGLLGLANDTTMETRSFQMIEDRIGPVIRKLSEDILLENLVAEK
jgi:hypothetical protein